MNYIEKQSYDYSGLSNFPDGFKFRYSEDGDICFATDCSTWAKKLINNLPLSVYLESEALVPPEVLHFPEFGTRERKKLRKESVGNYIEDCESCKQHMDATFSFCGRLVCYSCNNELKRQKCNCCGAKNRIAELFCNEGKVYQAPYCEDYFLELTLWNTMSYYCSNCYKEEYASYIYSNIQMDFLRQDDYEEDYGEGCRVCRGPTAGQGDICYYCRVDL